MHMSEASPAFKDFYLPDSWILDLNFDGDSLRLTCDLVLLESHPLYSSPLPAEQYSYLRADVVDF